MKLSHDKEANYIWTYDSAGDVFMENGVVFVPPQQPPPDQCTLYFQITSAIKQLLGNVFKNEEAYYAAHRIYSDNLSDLGMSGWNFQDVTIVIKLGNNGQSYIATGTSQDHVWLMNEKSELIEVAK